MNSLTEKSKGLHFVATIARSLYTSKAQTCYCTTNIYGVLFFYDTKKGK